MSINLLAEFTFALQQQTADLLSNYRQNNDPLFTHLKFNIPQSAHLKSSATINQQQQCARSNINHPTSIMLSTLALLALSHLCLGFRNTSLDNDCPDFGAVEHGIARIDITISGDVQITVRCDTGFELEGPSEYLCSDGIWDPNSHPNCSALCEIPSGIPYGNVQIHGSKNKEGMYRKGAIATYTCEKGYSIEPVNSEVRICLEGAWSGSRGTCARITGCPRPRNVVNGYFVLEKYPFAEEYVVGERLHYSCNPGFVLDGMPFQQCLDDGSWSPKIPPVCERKGKRMMEYLLGNVVIKETDYKSGKPVTNYHLHLKRDNEI